MWHVEDFKMVQLNEEEMSGLDATSKMLKRTESSGGNIER